MIRLRRKSQALVAALIAALLVSACTRGGVHRWHPNLYSVDQDINLGRRLSKQVEEEVPILRHSTLTQLINGIGRRLLTDPPHPAFLNFPYAFTVVDSPEINAFALPGGSVYVNSGLVTLLDTEDQLAAVIAHEMSHVAARHATEILTTVNASNFLLLVTLSVIPVAIPPTALEGARLAYILSLLRYSRGKESEADTLGIRMMWNAGYDPGEMATVFRRFQEERRAAPTLLERLFSSHPVSSDRMHTVEEQAAALGLPPVLDPSPAALPHGQVRAMFAKE